MSRGFRVQLGHHCALLRFHSPCDMRVHLLDLESRTITNEARRSFACRKGSAIFYADRACAQSLRPNLQVFFFKTAVFCERGVMCITCISKDKGKYNSEK